MLSFSSSPCIYYSGYHYGLITIAGSLSFLRLLSNWYSCVPQTPTALVLCPSLYAAISLWLFLSSSHISNSSSVNRWYIYLSFVHHHLLNSLTPTQCYAHHPFLFMTLMPLSFICHSSYFFSLLTLIWGREELIKGFFSSFVVSGIVH